jgi:Ca-activated chloride channel family protein
VGPYYTNTRDGLILAQRHATSQHEVAAARSDDRRMAAELPHPGGGRLKERVRLNPLVISKTLEEVNRFPNAGSDQHLRALTITACSIRQNNEVCRGKACFYAVHAWAIPADGFHESQTRHSVGGADWEP